MFSAKRLHLSFLYYYGLNQIGMLIQYELNGDDEIDHKIVCCGSNNCI